MNTAIDKKVVIITGANGGIGMHYCREMLSNGFHVVMACRSERTGKQALATLQQEFTDPSIELMLVDMSDVESIKQFSALVLSKFKRLDALVHNAGIYFFDKTKKLSAQNIELNLAIHFVGPFVLTASLFPLLKQTDQSKVISMSSKEHHGFKVDETDIQIILKTLATWWRMPEANGRSLPSLTS